MAVLRKVNREYWLWKPLKFSGRTADTDLGKVCREAGQSATRESVRSEMHISSRGLARFSLVVTSCVADQVKLIDSTLLATPLIEVVCSELFFSETRKNLPLLACLPINSRLLLLDFLKLAQFFEERLAALAISGIAQCLEMQLRARYAREGASASLPTRLFHSRYRALRSRLALRRPETQSSAGLAARLFRGSRARAAKLSELKTNAMAFTKAKRAEISPFDRTVICRSCFAAGRRGLPGARPRPGRASDRRPFDKLQCGSDLRKRRKRRAATEERAAFCKCSGVQTAGIKRLRLSSIEIGG